jgi:chromatin remodeling complex protein RSC6
LLYRGFAGIRKARDFVNLIEYLQWTRLQIPFDPSSTYDLTPSNHTPLMSVSDSETLGVEGTQDFAVNLASILNKASCHVRLSTIISTLINDIIQQQPCRKDTSDHLLVMAAMILCNLRPCDPSTYSILQKVFNRREDYESEGRCVRCESLLRTWQLCQNKGDPGDRMYCCLTKLRSRINNSIASDTGVRVLGKLEVLNPTRYNHGHPDPGSDAFFEVRRQFVQWVGDQKLESAREWLRRIRDFYIRCEDIMRGHQGDSGTIRISWKQECQKMGSKVTELTEQIANLQACLMKLEDDKTNDFPNQTKSPSQSSTVERTSQSYISSHPFGSSCFMVTNVADKRDSSAGKMVDRQIVPRLKEVLSELKGIQEEMSQITSSFLILQKEVPMGMATTGVKDGENRGQKDESPRDQEDASSEEHFVRRLLTLVECDNTNISSNKKSSGKILESEKISRNFSTDQSFQERYYLKPTLAKFMGMDTACLSEVMQRFWSYILTKGLIHNDDMRYCKTDHQLGSLFQGSVHVHILDSAMLLSQHFALTATVNSEAHRGVQGQGEVDRGFRDFQVDTP